MKRWIFTILLFLLLGAVVNVAVAWGCAAWVSLPPTLEGELDHPYAQGPRPQDATDRLDERWLARTGWKRTPPDEHSVYRIAVQSSSSIGVTRREFLEWECDNPESPGPGRIIQHLEVFARQVRSGWPMRSLLGGHLPESRFRPLAEYRRYSPPRIRPSGNFRRRLRTVDAIDIGLRKPFEGERSGRDLPLAVIWPGFFVNTLFYAVILGLLIPGPFVLRGLVRRKRGRCPKCGYDLRGELQAGCPECGWGREEARSVMRSIVLDHQDRIQLDPGHTRHYHNELQVLDAWRHGMHFLYQQVRAMEQATIAEMAEIRSARDVSGSPGTECPFPNLGCCFQWYAVTLCNFAELVGCIGWEIDNTRRPPRDYIRKTVPVILAYRNYVAAHPARARPGRSNAAERLGSLLPPSSLINGRYFAGAWKVSAIVSGTVSDSGKIQPWSLTIAHEELAARYWPQHRRDESQDLT